MHLTVFQSVFNEAHQCVELVTTEQVSITKPLTMEAMFAAGGKPWSRVRIEGSNLTITVEECDEHGCVGECEIPQGVMMPPRRLFSVIKANKKDWAVAIHPRFRLPVDGSRLRFMVGEVHDSDQLCEELNAAIDWWLEQKRSEA